MSLLPHRHIPVFPQLPWSVHTRQTTDVAVFTCFRTSWVGQVITQNSVWCLEKLRFVPKGTYDVGETLRIAGKHLVLGGQDKLFTYVHFYFYCYD